MSSAWDALLGDDRERALRDELERTWARLTDASQASVQRLARARDDADESPDLLQAVWTLHHALDGAVVVGGSALCLVLHAATRGGEAELGRARYLAARAAPALARGGVTAVLASGWVAVALRGGRFFATDAQEGDLRTLMVLLLARADRKDIRP